MKMRYIILLSLLLSFTSIYADQIEEEVKHYTSNLPFEMPELSVPEFPERIFNIIDFDAVGDGHSLNTDAFRKAIDECSNKGGGTVLVPPGMWYTGPIQLKSNINLHLEKGAFILFSKNHDDYKIINMPRRGIKVESPINGYNLENIAITGEGIIDGSGETWRPVKKSKLTSSQWKELIKSGGVVDEKNSIWWPSKEAMEGEQVIDSLESTKKELTPEDYLPAKDFLRPYMVLFVNCKNILIDGTTFQNSPMFTIVPNWSENIIIRNVKVNNEWWAQNGDGIDISSCKNVLIYNSIITAGDDAICMKSSKTKSGGPSLQNIVIADCIVYHGHGGFVIGSNTDGGMKNISVKNCSFVGTDIGLRFKSARDRGGVVEDIFIENIFMKDIKEEAVLFSTYYEQKGTENTEVNETEKTPVFQKFYLKNIICNGANQAFLVEGLPEMPIKDISLYNITITAGKGFDSKFADGFLIDNIKIYSKDAPVFSFYQSSNFNIKSAACPNSINTFAEFKGDKTGSIYFEKTDLSKCNIPLDISAEVNKSEIGIK